MRQKNIKVNMKKLRASLPEVSQFRKSRKSLSNATTGLDSGIRSCQSYTTTRKTATQFLQDTIECFPQWLKDCKDFQESIQQLVHKENTDIASSGELPKNNRNPLQSQALEEWCVTTTFFKGILKGDIPKLCRALTTAYYEPGEILIKEGDIGNFMCIIVLGDVDIYRDGVRIATVGPKNSLGETALETDNPRNASCIAATAVAAFILKKEDYLEIVLKQKKLERYKIIGLLREVRGFSGLAASKIERIAWNVSSVHYRPDEIIYRIGDESIHFFMLLEGSVKLETYVKLSKKNRIPVEKNNYQTLTSVRTYKRQVRQCQKFDFFGETELVSDKKRFHQAIAMENTLLLFLNAEKYREIFTDKEKQNIYDTYPFSSSMKHLKKTVDNELIQSSKSIKAFLNALELSPINIHCNNLTRTRKKIGFSNNVVQRYRRRISQELVQEELVFNNS